MPRQFWTYVWQNVVIHSPICIFFTCIFLIIEILFPFTYSFFSWINYFCLNKKIRKKIFLLKVFTVIVNRKAKLKQWNLCSMKSHYESVCNICSNYFFLYTLGYDLQQWSTLCFLKKFLKFSHTIFKHKLSINWCYLFNISFPDSTYILWRKL